MLIVPSLGQHSSFLLAILSTQTPALWPFSQMHILSFLCLSTPCWSLLVVLFRFVAWFETSAKTDHKIDAAATHLVENILTHEEIFEEKNRKRAQMNAGTLRPGSTPQVAQNSGGGCC